MLEKITFWVVLVWMVALLCMTLWAVREVWKEDTRELTEPAPPDANDRDTAATDVPPAAESPGSGGTVRLKSGTSDTAGGLKP